MKIDELQPQSTPNIKGFKPSEDLLLFNKATDHIKESKQPFCEFNNVTFFNGKDGLYRQVSGITPRWVKMSECGHPGASAQETGSEGLKSLRKGLEE